MFDDFHVFLVGTGIGKPRIYAFSSRFSFADVLFTRNPVGWLGILYYPIICHIYFSIYVFTCKKHRRGLVYVEGLCVHGQRGLRPQCRLRRRAAHPGGSREDGTGFRSHAPWQPVGV